MPGRQFSKQMRQIDDIAKLSIVPCDQQITQDLSIRFITAQVNKSGGKTVLESDPGEGIGMGCPLPRPNTCQFSFGKATLNRLYPLGDSGY